nr:immunoglobulin heavy chain junction region [Homo sapiens]
CARAPRGGG